jgi:hypothetical protein
MKHESKKEEVHTFTYTAEEVVDILKQAAFKEIYPKLASNEEAGAEDVSVTYNTSKVKTKTKQAVLFDSIKITILNPFADIVVKPA